MTVAVSGQARSCYGSAGSCPGAHAADLAGCRLCCHQGGSALAADRHATARTSPAATEAIRAARPADRQAAALGSRPAGFTSSFPGPDGRSAEPRRVMASWPATPIERLLADAVPTRRRESPEHVTPAHQAGREAAQRRPSEVFVPEANPHAGRRGR